MMTFPNVEERVCPEHSRTAIATLGTNEEPEHQKCPSSKNSRQRPTLPHSYPCSTIGGRGLNYRVRYGNACFPSPMATGKYKPNPAHLTGARPPLHTYLVSHQGILSFKEPTEYPTNDSFPKTK